MRVEQRIGRLDRLGQKSPRVAIWNLIHRGTIDERIYERLFQRLRIFEHTLGGLEVVLGEQIERLAADLFRRHLTPVEEAARIEQTGIAVENRRRQEEELEGEAAALVAYGDYILSQVEAARRLDRRVGEQDLQRYVSGLLQQLYPGCRLQGTVDPLTLDIELSAAAKNDLAAFLRDRRSPATTRLVLNAPGPVRCRFENRIVEAARAPHEVINQVHPLVRFAAHGAEEAGFAGRCAMAARLRESHVQGLPCTKGDYLLVVTRWLFEALRPFDQLWFGAMVVADGAPLPAEVAEALAFAVARHGEPWPTADVELDLPALASRLEQTLLQQAWASFRAEVSRMRGQNEDRADAQAQSLRSHLARQRDRLRELSFRHRSRGRVGLARAEEKNLERLEKRVERELLALERRRQLKYEMREVAVGVARIH